MSYNKATLSKHIKILQEQFVITYVDKSTNNYVINYKVYYNQLNTIFPTNNHFKLSKESLMLKK